VALKQRIQDDIKAALLGGDRFKSDVLSNLKASILNEEVAKNKRDEGLSDSEIEQIVSREVKKRSESADLYTKAGRQELADSELKERDLLIEYLPKQLSEDEIKAVVLETIDEISKSGNINMGMVIGSVKQKLGTSADGAVVAKIVKESLYYI